MAFPVVVHEDAAQVRVAVETKAHQIEGLTLVPVRGRPDPDEAGHLLAVVDPRLQANARCAGADPEQVVAERESVWLRLRQTLVALCRGLVQIASARRADVTGDTLRAPAEIVGRRDVRQVVEAQLVAKVKGGLDETRRIDDECGLAVPFENFDEPGDAVVVQDATPRIS
jgi:hypothetical protein